MNLFDWLLSRAELKVSANERIKACRTCEVLRHELAVANAEKSKLLDVLLERSEPAKPEPIVIAPPVMETRSGLQQVPGTFRSWDEKRRTLEAEDAAKAMALRREKEQAEIARRNAELAKEVENA